MATKFQIGEAIGFGWDIFKKNVGFFIKLQLFIFFVIYILPSVITDGLYPLFEYGMTNGGTVEPEGAALVLLIIVALLVFLFSIFITVVQWVVSMGLIKISLNFIDGAVSAIKTLFEPWKLILRYIGSTILYVLIVIGGLILLIVPGIIWAIKYQFYVYLIVDKKMKVMESIKKSGEITKGSIWLLFLFGLAIVGINILGFLCLIVGLLATIPLSMVAYAFVYRRLLEKAGAAA